MAASSDFDVWYVVFPHHPAALLGTEGEDVAPTVSDDFAALEAMGLRREKRIGERRVRRDYSNTEATKQHGWSGVSIVTLNTPDDYLVHEDFRNGGQGPEPYYYFFSTEQDARAWVRAWELSKGHQQSLLRPGSRALEAFNQHLIRLWQHLRFVEDPANAQAIRIGDEEAGMTLLGSPRAVALMRLILSGSHARN
jgi:hypothetical protein